ncbi:hypothetical protein CC85DRAFT_300225 [Cutaneotrichosporon oleaginosum]|uniref:Uncharacterized protein n=1 Tax=Cutaneotrichosporon oleaginosum TaxID=879819 RepID=A0A0J0XUF2_9TREE|nr:uncharacterized protein CC85DRAFT_300225 [Cutaneotrichosporon oleaginosum]KLT44677.1 hypothetical protein CC85DRAFT_300225 [Cutaneotrichosporon oleaginosum]TXT07664.1 hypothetical protein COLE_04588 [Cutaneotrichosporon oleaginosum]
MPDTPYPPKLTITSRVSVRPPPGAAEPLSLAGSAATMWPVVPVTLLFPPTTVDERALTQALQHVVSTYPLLGARLDTTPPAGDWPAHTTRYRRAWAYYDGPGAALAFATHAGSINDVLPKANGRVLDADAASANDLCDSPIVVLRPEAMAQTGPALALQITRFSDGIALGLRAHHAILDAHSAANVIGAWFKSYNALLKGAPLPTLNLSFDRTPIDAAAGAIDAPGPDPALLALADTLPGLRLDMTQNTDTAFPIAALTRAPGAPETEGAAPPWSTWDWASYMHVQQRVLSFTTDEVARLKARAGSKSSLDALYALVWGAIVRARGLPENTNVSFGECIGLRGRVPGVGPEHCGADLIITAAQMNAAETADLRDTARAIRSAIDAYTPTTIGAELHRMAYASDPARRWNMFFGREHIHTTSWLHIGMYDLQIADVKPTWVQAAFPGLDGLVCALEAPGGVNVQLWLEPETMARVVRDPVFADI